MRKFLWVVLAGTLVLALAVPAMALDFKFGSEYRVRFYGGVGVGFVGTDGSAPRGAQIRIRPLFDVKDDNGNIQGLLRLEIGDIEFGNGGGATGTPTNGVALTSTARVGNGSGGMSGNDGVNVETKWAWIDAAFPFGVPLRVRAGLQPWYLPKGIIEDDDTVGVRLYGSVKPVSYDLAWYRISSGALGATPVAPNVGQPVIANQNTQDNNYDFYQLKVDVAVAEFFNPGLYYLFGRNAATTLPQGSLDTNYFGFTATGKVGIVSYDFDFVWGSAEGGPNGLFCRTTATGAGVACTSAGVSAGTQTVSDVSGYAVDAAVHVPIGPVTLNLAGSYATGDDRGGGDSDAFPGGIGPAWNGPGGLFQLIGSGGIFDAVEYTQDAPTNLWAVGLTADYRPVKQLLLTAGAAYAGFAKTAGNCSTVKTVGGVNQACFGPSYAKLAGRSTLGAEFFLLAQWDIWTGFKLQGEIGFLVPPAGVTAQEYVLQMLYSF